MFVVTLADITTGFRDAIPDATDVPIPSPRFLSIYTTHNAKKSADTMFSGYSLVRNYNLETHLETTD